MAFLPLECSREMDSGDLVRLLEALPVDLRCSRALGWAPIGWVWGGQFAPMDKECRCIYCCLVSGRVHGELESVDALIPIPVLLPNVLGDHCFDRSVRPFRGVTVRRVNGRGPMLNPNRE